MKEITRWFQGGSYCYGFRQCVEVPGARGMTLLAPVLEEGSGPAYCLALACGDPFEYNKAEVKALDALITRLFPERACRCGCGRNNAWTRVVHFNNHPETTRDQIDKIIHTYHMEND